MYKKDWLTPPTSEHDPELTYISTHLQAPPTEAYTAINQYVDAKGIDSGPLHWWAGLSQSLLSRFHSTASYW